MHVVIEKMKSFTRSFSPLRLIRLLQNMKKYWFFIIILAISLLASCRRESVRTRIDFGRDWKFYLGDDSLAFQPGYDDSDWRLLDVPHDWSIEGEFSEDHPAKPEGGALPTGMGWYRKYFKIEKRDKNKRFYIDFDGAYRNSEVWINGHYLGKRANGYISFRYELIPFLHYGNKKNVIAVKVDNSLQPNSRWYTGSGIYRNVWLVSTSKVHVDHWGVFVTTPLIDKENAIIHAEIKLTGRVKDFENIRIRASVVDANGRHTGENEAAIAVKNTIPGILSLTIPVGNPQLWSIDTPYLYQLKTEVFTDKGKVDECITAFGIRSFRFSADNGFFLNGKPLEIRGVNLHHDLGALGAAVNERALERQLELMKGMGVNAIRTAHNPPAPELLDLCDRMGFIVMVEAFDVWKKKKVKYDYHIDWNENYKRDLSDMVLRDRNHPSVFIWSIGNEIREQFDSTGISIAKDLVEIVKSLDTTRPVTCALTETNPEKNYIYQSGALDLLGFNYKIFDWPEFPENFPGQKMIATENMSVYSTRGHYDLPSDSVRYWPRRYGEPIIGANPDYTVSAYDMVCAYWGATHYETLKALSQNKFIPALFIWSGIDFIGEPEPYGWPAKSSYYGVVDLAGFPKDVYYLYQSIWTDKPVLHIFPHWNWDEGQVIDIWAYYNHADEVELFLNDISLGTKKKEDDRFHVMWRVNYKPGELKAWSRRFETVIMEKVIKTAGTPYKIELIPDKQHIQADGKDLSFVTVRITDENGTLVPYADNLIKFEINGPGFIAGVDNGYQASHEPFKANHRKAFNGMCLVIIQTSGKKGSITLNAQSEHLISKTVTLKAR